MHDLVRCIVTCGRMVPALSVQSSLRASRWIVVMLSTQTITAIGSFTALATSPTTQYNSRSELAGRGTMACSAALTLSSSRPCAPQRHQAAALRASSFLAPLRLQCGAAAAAAAGQAAGRSRLVVQNFRYDPRGDPKKQEKIQDCECLSPSAW